jgi:hypothetical protein
MQAQPKTILSPSMPAAALHNYLLVHGRKHCTLLLYCFHPSTCAIGIHCTSKGCIVKCLSRIIPRQAGLRSSNLSQYHSPISFEQVSTSILSMLILAISPYPPHPKPQISLEHSVILTVLTPHLKPTQFVDVYALPLMHLFSAAVAAHPASYLAHPLVTIAPLPSLTNNRP